MKEGGQSWAHEVLVASARRSVSEEALGRGTDEEWQRLFDAAGAHGATGWLARELRARPSVAQPWQLMLQGAALAIAQNHARRLGDATAALSVLEKGGVSPMVLKGPALVERYFGDTSLRPYGDVDIYVHPGHFRRAVELLESAGYRLKDRNWDFIVGDMRGQLHFTAPSGGVIELHWHVVNSVRQRRTLRMAPDELWDGAIESQLGSTACMTLAPGDELAHLCLHAALHGCNRLIWLLDIRAMTEAADVDWDATARRLEKWRFGPGGYLVLQLAAELTGARPPLDQLRPLRPGAVTRASFRRLVDKWDLANVAHAAQVRELFFATAAKGTARMGLATDVVIPGAGQRTPGPDRGWAQKARRVTVGSYERVRSKLGGQASDFAEYRVQGDPESGRLRFFEAIESGSADPPLAGTS